MRKQFITTLAAVLFLAVTGFATSAKAGGTCNLQTIKGSYGYVITGSAFGSSIAGVGTLTFDGAGNVSGKDTNTFDLLNTIAYTGTYTVNDDCTGTFTTVFSNGFVVPSNIVIADNGKELFMIVTIPGEVVTGTYKRQ